jgi:hypothetical protein
MSPIARKIVCLLLVVVSAAGAEPKPLTKEEQARIDDAINRAVTFLKGAQTDRGGWNWRMYRDGRFQAAQSAMPGYALLESGVPTDDPVIQKAADYIRPQILKSDYTYEICLALLFYERRGDPVDRPLIQTLAARLLAGQHFTGGWSYRCPILDEKTETALLTTLGQLKKVMKDNGLTREQALVKLEVPPALRNLPVFRVSSAVLWREPAGTREAILDAANRASLDGRTDNSNTQFAMLGLWAAQRQGVPVEPSFELMVTRIERSHSNDGAWWYTLDEEGGTRSMTCVGLMGLAIGRGLHLATPGNAGGKKDVHILRGLSALSGRVGKPAYRMDKPIPFHDLYFLWSVERVAMLYDLPSIGEKDWYRWGAESLVTNQTKAGWWSGASPQPEWVGRKNYDYKATLSTSFALLFLKRAHPMKDLTPKLPLTGKELNEGIASLRPEDKYPVRIAQPATPSRNRQP